MKISQAMAITGSLGAPSKMPGTSYGISASKCILGSKLTKVAGSVCEGCYAAKGFYRLSNVEKAMGRRLDGLHHP